MLRNQEKEQQMLEKAFKESEMDQIRQLVFSNEKTDDSFNYVCTDVSRKIFKFKNGLGELEKDVNAKKLTNILSENGLFEIYHNNFGQMKMEQ